MKRFGRITTAAAAVVALSAAGGATSASAYSISGGAYTGVGAHHTFSVGGGAYTFSCSSSSFPGTATGADTTSFTPSYSGCTHLGFPLLVSQSGTWDLKVTGSSGLVYSGALEIPAGTSTTMSIPLMGCTFVVAGPQTFGGVSMINYATGVNLSAAASSIAYTATGCPFGSGTDGTYNSNGDVVIPGITVS